MENNNKESFKLLGVSASDTDSGSDVPEFVLAPPRKKRIKRRLRGTSGSRARHQHQSCNCHGRTVILSLASILLFCWLVTITWFAIVFHGELKRLEADVHNVVAGSQGVQDSLQKCHTVSKVLQQNQTSLSNGLSELEGHLNTFTAQLNDVKTGLEDVQNRLKAAPELVNLPNDVKSLSTSVASFGSQIRDLNTTVTALKNENSVLHETSKTLFQNVTTLKQRVMELANVSQQPQAPSSENNADREEMLSMLKQLSANITLVNDTLSEKLKWVSDDQEKYRRAFVALQEISQNVSAHLTTLEGDYVKYELYSALNNSVGKLSLQVNNDEKQLSDLVSQLSQLQMQAKQLVNNGTQLADEINSISEEFNKFVHSQSNLLTNIQPVSQTESVPTTGAAELLTSHNPSNGEH